MGIIVVKGNSFFFFAVYTFTRIGALYHEHMKFTFLTLGTLQ